MRSLLFIGLILLLTHCASPRERREQQFAAIQMGMTKSEVIEVAGSPHWSDRWEGHDRWIYYLAPEAKQTERVVYFKQGVVVRKGERIKPALSAEEMDQLKKPRPNRKAREFTPSMSEDELRKAIQKEIKNQKNKKPEPKFESI